MNLCATLGFAIASRLRLARISAVRSLALFLFALPVSGWAQSGPVAAYGLNAAGGIVAADYSGNNLDGELNAGAAFTPSGKYGGGLLLELGSGHVDLGNPTALQMTGSMTVSAWIRASAFPADDAAIVSKFDGHGFQLDTTVDTGIRTLGFKLSSPGGDLMARYGATVLQLNQWYHVAGVYDAQAQTLTVYLNGQLDNGTLSGTVSSSQMNSPMNVFIGQRPDYLTYPFSGTIDEVRIYNRALTQGEIQADMNAPVAASDSTAPSAPAGLTATAASNSRLNLAWNASTDNFDVTAYRVERCQGSGCTNFAEVASATDLAFYNSGLAASTLYRYRLRAQDGAGNLSSYSAIAAATTLSVPTVGGRVGAYPLDEGSGTSTADFSSLGHTGSLNGAVWTSSGAIGKALSFTGSGAYVDLGNPGPMQLTGSMTVSAWIYATAFPVDDGAIVSKLDGSVPGGFLGFQLDTTVDTGVRTVGFKLTNLAGFMIRYGATPLQANQWYHVAGVYDAQARTLSVFLNGQPDNGNLFGTVAGSQRNSPRNVTIGQRPDCVTCYPFSGTIDEVRIYNRTLTQAEIQSDMNASASGPGPGPQPDINPPSAPAGLTATPVGQTQINLSWTASSDNVGVTGYRVEGCQGAGCSTFAQIGTPTATTFSSMGLAAATTYRYRVLATDAAGNLSPYSNVAEATTTGSTPTVGVSVENPFDGAVITSDTVTVSGTFFGPGNTGVTVNGVVAAIVDNTFVATSVPLQVGANTLTVMLTTPSNQTATQTLSVTSTGPAPIEVVASPAYGVAPVTVTFTINNRTANTIQAVQADYSGTGNFVVVSPAALSNNYTASGIYRAAFIITDSTGTSYQRTVPIAVQSIAQIDVRLRTAWGEFSAALASANTTLALTYFTAQAQQKFQPVFQILGADLPQIVASFSPLQSVSVTSEIGEYAINRTIGGVNWIYFIYFMRDTDGVWRIDDM